MDATTLHDAVAEVCPITSVSVGNANDRATWKYFPTGAATSTELAAADNVVATIPIEPLTSVSSAAFISRWTNAEYVKLEQKRLADTQAAKVGNSKNWDVVIGDQMIDMNKKKVKTLKADLVTDGILTQARADIIFA